MPAFLPRCAPVNRLGGELPKVGIRPVVDGRYGGVRESLEPVCMAMALAAQRLIESKLKHACGLPIQCVIADSPIGGFADAVACKEKFRREGVGVSLSVTPCWCYGMETMDDDPHLPKAIWGFNGSDRPGAVYLAATLSGHAQTGLPCFGIYGRDVQDMDDIETIPPDVEEKLLRFVQSGMAVAEMRGKAYLAMGAISMGIAGSAVDREFFERWLGMRVEQVDMSEFSGRLKHEIYDAVEFEKAYAWVRANCPEGKDWNPPAKQRSRQQKDEDWETSVKMTLIARDLMVGNPRLAELGFKEQARGHAAIAGGFQGQRQWTDYFPNGDFMEAILNTSFDWNGIRQPYIVATENDSLNGASMLLGHLLTGQAQMFSDVRTYWSPATIKRVTGYETEGVLHLINSGPSPLDFTGEAHSGTDIPIRVSPSSADFPVRASGKARTGMSVPLAWWKLDSNAAKKCLEATKWGPSDLGYFPGGGWSTDFTTRGNLPLTMYRINLVRGLGPVLQIAEGHSVELPPEVHQKLDERTNPTWPTTWFRPDCDGKPGPFQDPLSVMSHWGANHGAISFGHIGAELITLASMLRIPVDMHNVGQDDIYRPAVWKRFGSHDLQGADYRACGTFGPLY